MGYRRLFRNAHPLRYLSGVRFVGVFAVLALGACGNLMGTEDTGSGTADASTSPRPSDAATDTGFVVVDGAVVQLDATAPTCPPGASPVASVCAITSEPTCTSAIMVPTPDNVTVVGAVCVGKSPTVTSCGGALVPGHAFHATQNGKVTVKSLDGTVGVNLIDMSCTTALNACATAGVGASGTINVTAGQYFVIANTGAGCVQYKLVFTPA